MHLIEIKQVAARFQRLAGEFEQYTFVDSHEISSSVVIPQAAKVAAFGIFPRSILLLQTLFGKRVQENKAIMNAENRIEKRKTAGFLPQSP